MKLIDLLVQELPKRGGWPNGAEYCHLTQYDRHCLTIVFSHKQVGTGNNSTTSSEEMVFSGIGHLGDTLYGCIVTAKEYESALAASQKPTWDGEGVPPVGCECEYLDNNGKWYPVTIKYASAQLVVISGVTKILGVEQGTEIAKDIIIDKPQFRPLRTEAERKRDEAISEIGKASQLISNNKEQIKHIAKHIYDAIAAGKIPGVKLDD